MDSVPQKDVNTSTDVKPATSTGLNPVPKEDRYIEDRVKSDNGPHEPAGNGRKYDKPSHSGTGRVETSKREGGGPHNWGEELDSEVAGALDAKRELEEEAAQTGPA